MNDRHRGTLEVYERRAAEWQRRRPPRMDEAVRFTAELTAMADRNRADDNLPDGTLPDGTLPDGTLPAGAVVDLGCGPGWHLPALPEGTIAVDGAAAMVDLVAGHSPGSPVVQADLRALPFARHSLRAVWANKSLVHLERSRVPLALWDLHRAMAVGAVAHLGLFGGDREHEGFDDDPFAGRSFSLWPPDLLADVVTGPASSCWSSTSPNATPTGATSPTWRCACAGSAPWPTPSARACACFWWASTRRCTQPTRGWASPVPGTGAGPRWWRPGWPRPIGIPCTCSPTTASA